MLPEDVRPHKPVPPPSPCICPHCGHAHGAYDQQASLLLDHLTIATDALRAAKHLVEEEVLP
jgi:hypothetical protein